MWIFTNYGFFSFTQSTFKPGFIQIRARDDRDLADLKTRHKLKGQIIETTESDYRWRILVKPETAGRILADEAAAIDYSNFKNATTDRMHARPLMEVWSAMMRVQRARVAELYGPAPGTHRSQRSAGFGLSQSWWSRDDDDDQGELDLGEFRRPKKRRGRGHDSDGEEIPF